MSSSTPAPASATQLLCDPQDHYELKKVLGRGSFGAVYVAVRKADNVEVAVKRLEVRRRKREKNKFFSGCFFFFFLFFSWLRAFVVLGCVVAVVCGWAREWARVFREKKKREMEFFIGVT
jgi:serine/threonine protein kinase